MNYNLTTEKLSGLARLKILSDFLIDEDNKIESDDLSLKLHAGAISLYAAALITKIYETNPDALLIGNEQRESALCLAIQNSPKFSHLSGDEISLKAHELIIKDLRNCFAHGNFEIGYNLEQKGIYFILQPQRKDFVVDVPIIISNKVLKDAIMGPIMELSFALMFKNDENKTTNLDNVNELFKTFLLPTQMLKFADYYLETTPFKTKPNVEGFKSTLIQYILLATQITYEQDDYYNIFGKDSNIFERISLIRNSIAHDSFLFEELAKDINYTDRDRTLNETLIKSVAVLTTACDMKEAIKNVDKKFYSETSINSLKDKLMECFDMLFENNNTESLFEENHIK